MLTNLNNSLILLFLHTFDFTIFAKITAKTLHTSISAKTDIGHFTYLYWMFFIEDCHSSIYWVVSTTLFLDFHGKWHWSVT